MVELTGPYRFVPPASRVVTPHWAKHISHDIPFEDSISGHIQFTIDAREKIFVGSGKDSERADGEVPFYRTANGKYAIPATTLKGMVRNLVEILSFSNLKKGVFDNETPYPIRSISNNEYLNFVPRNSLVVGLLEKTGEEDYRFLELESVRVRKVMEDHAWYAEGEGQFRYVDRIDSRRVKADLYEKISEEAADQYGRIRKGYRVRTGPMHNKEYDHLFLTKPQPEVVPFAGNQVVHHFFAAYEYDLGLPDVKDEEGQEKEIHEHTVKLREEAAAMRNTSVIGSVLPVFATKIDGRIVHLGLSTNYRVTSKLTVHEAVANAYDVPPDGRPDLAECIFGHLGKEVTDESGDTTTVENRSLPLKGRVFFHNAPVGFNPGLVKEPIEVALLSPTPSFYPAYLQGTATYLDENAKIAGWKRYPIHNKFAIGKGVKVSNDKMKVTFRPMKKGATFFARVDFHNLRRVELGALLSALTLHGTMSNKDNSVYFNIGMGKPLGLGKVKFTSPIVRDAQNNKLNPNEYLKVFESYMNAATGSSEPTWHVSDTVSKLRDLCQPASNDEHLKSLTGERGTRLMGSAKNEGAYLAQHYPAAPVDIPSYADEQSISNARIWIAREQAEQNQLAPLDEKQRAELQEKLLRWLQDRA